ncbi:hypothetical protein AVEN_219087-1 [Araneus ventricosus]|uniref:Uncharacterized protein n=1 Tax=Araneus ventricosus TaxID=182803 RepID=A0A4Y2M8J6_ARAVE|nr:hypothetical protein AVEN_219087-1 [Araneus ventricosus]
MCKSGLGSKFKKSSAERIRELRQRRKENGTRRVRSLKAAKISNTARETFVPLIDALQAIELSQHRIWQRIWDRQTNNKLYKIQPSTQPLYVTAAHENRQSDVYRSIKTLDELTAQLKLDGFSVSRSGVYLRLLPKRNSTLEGKQHVVTAPVKLNSAQNDSHLKHIDGQFCVASIKRLEELSSFLGPLEVCFISQDDSNSANWLNRS